jgi:hypothetical protein
MATIPTTPPAQQRSPGRAYFWVGICICLLGPLLVMAQFSWKHLGVPWYSPVLASLGAVLLLVAVVRRPGIVRVVALLLVAGFAALQWYFLAMVKLPAYDGPAQAGKQLPAFSTTLADGRPFTEADLRDGSRRVLVFFRGRW